MHQLLQFYKIYYKTQRSRGRDLRGPTEGRAKATRKGEEEEGMDFGGHVETCRQENLRATGNKVPDEDLEAEPSNRGKPKRGQEARVETSGEEV